MEQQLNPHEPMPGGKEINDGRRDIILRTRPVVEGETVQPDLFVSQELYEALGFKYDQMKTPDGLGRFLSTYGMYVLHSAGHTEILDIVGLMNDYKQLKDFIEYFVNRCEGKPVPEGHGQIMSRRAYEKAKGVLDGINTRIKAGQDSAGTNDIPKV